MKLLFKKPAGQNNQIDKPHFPIWLIIVFILVVSGIMISGGWFYQSQKSQMEQSVTNELTAIAELKVDQITSWLGERIGDSNVIMVNPFITNGILE